jgi:hypothetical protein
VLYSEEELTVLWQEVKKTTAPPRDLTLAEANRLVARLGGYAGRKHDGEPGAESIGRGLSRLLDMARGARIHLPSRALRKRRKKCV